MIWVARRIRVGDDEMDRAVEAMRASAKAIAKDFWLIAPAHVADADVVSGLCEGIADANRRPAGPSHEPVGATG